MRIATIVARRELARARVLASSVAEHAPGASTVALVLDMAGEQPSESLELLAPGAAGIEGFEQLAATLPFEALREACKPLLLEHLVERSDGTETIVYLGCESLVLGTLEDVEERARSEGVLVRTRTRAEIPEDGRRPNEADLHAWGLHDDGLLVLGAGREHSELLAWWSERARAGGVEAGGGRTFERIVSRAGASEIDDPGVGLSFFDMRERVLVRGDDGLTVDGAPLRLLRLPAFDPSDPARISTAQDRLRAEDRPELAALCERYARLLEHAGEREAAALPYGFERLPDGTRLDLRMRGICAQWVEETGGSSPFTREGMQEFYDWLRAPAAAGAGSGMNRLCLLLREHHPELRSAYPDLDSPDDALGMIEWIREHGVREGTVPDEVVPPSSADEREAERRRQLRRTNFGVNVVGYFTSEMGLGEGHRLLVAALDAAAVPLLPMLPPTLPPARNEHSYATVPLGVMGFPANLIAINGDGLLRFRDEAGSGFFRGHHNIGLWWWEVDTLPESWLPGFELLDEIWVGSEHVADALAAISPVPVYKVRFPIARPPLRSPDRLALGIDGRWAFLSVFDHHSVLERKNPIGTIRAFTEAFTADSGAVLLVKSMNADSDPAGRERIEAAAAGHPHVRLLERTLSRAQTDALIEACDCVVSLHRAEGFGHVLAEAMALGKPVVATGYSGNLDFMTSENSYLVDYELREVGAGCWPYPEHARWAEPDLADAARAMRAVFEDRRAAQERGAVAAATLARTHSLGEAGTSMRRRLATVVDRWEGPPYLPLYRSHVNITLGGRGRLLRRLAPGVVAAIERELNHMYEAQERLAFDIDAAARGPLLGTLATVLATLRRVESAAGEREGA